MRKKISTAWALVLLAVPTLAMADQEAAGNRRITLDEVVVTATRSEEKIREIPAKVEVVSREDIELTSAETITEQLKKNSAIDVIEYPGALAGIGIRGFRPESSGITKHSLILINGRPAGSTNPANILSDNIERVEVLKGLVSLRGRPWVVNIKRIPGHWPAWLKSGLVPLIPITRRQPWAVESDSGLILILRPGVMPRRATSGWGTVKPATTPGIKPKTAI
jgi:outer membrane receptor for Fe3+-dicitrate